MPKRKQHDTTFWKLHFVRVLVFFDFSLVPVMTLELFRSHRPQSKNLQNLWNKVFFSFLFKTSAQLIFHRWLEISLMLFFKFYSKLLIKQHLIDSGEKSGPKGRDAISLRSISSSQGRQSRRSLLIASTAAAVVQLLSFVAFGIDLFLQHAAETPQQQDDDTEQNKNQIEQEKKKVSLGRFDVAFVLLQHNIHTIFLPICLRFLCYFCCRPRFPFTASWTESKNFPHFISIYQHLPFVVRRPGMFRCFSQKSKVENSSHFFLLLPTTTIHWNSNWFGRKFRILPTRP